MNPALNEFFNVTPVCEGNEFYQTIWKLNGGRQFAIYDENPNLRYDPHRIIPRLSSGETASMEFIDEFKVNTPVLVNGNYIMRHVGTTYVTSFFIGWTNTRLSPFTLMTDYSRSDGVVRVDYLAFGGRVNSRSGGAIDIIAVRPCARFRIVMDYNDMTYRVRVDYFGCRERQRFTGLFCEDGVSVKTNYGTFEFLVSRATDSSARTRVVQTNNCMTQTTDFALDSIGDFTASVLATNPAYGLFVYRTLFGAPKN
jgi:hypothetical protein